MRSPDLVDKANFEQAKAGISNTFNALSDDIKLAVSRELTIDWISDQIDKFPLETQKEIVVMLADKYLRQWAT